MKDKRHMVIPLAIVLLALVACGRSGQRSQSAVVQQVWP